MAHNPKRIMERAIKKAIYGGWLDGNAALKELEGNPNWSIGYGIPFVMAVIFNQDFAKAVWGDGPNCAYCGMSPHMQHPRPCPEGSNIWPYVWEYRLQEMVIAKDPLEYLNIHLYS